MLNGSRTYVLLGYIIGVPAGFFIILLTFEVSKFICSKKIEKIELVEALKAQK